MLFSYAVRAIYVESCSMSLYAAAFTEWLKRRWGNAGQVQRLRADV